MKNIVLIGMPGSGKSTVGVLLAKALGYSFVDVDLIICKEAGKPLQEILDNEGLDFFLHHIRLIFLLLFLFLLHPILIFFLYLLNLFQEK